MNHSAAAPAAWHCSWLRTGCKRRIYRVPRPTCAISLHCLRTAFRQIAWGESRGDAAGPLPARCQPLCDIAANVQFACTSCCRLNSSHSMLSVPACDMRPLHLAVLTGSCLFCVSCSEMHSASAVQRCCLKGSMLAPALSCFDGGGCLSPTLPACSLFLSLPPPLSLTLALLLFFLLPPPPPLSPSSQ